MDSSDCGERDPCRTIEFVFVHRAVKNDIIKIENDEFMSESQPFTIRRSFPVWDNITLMGINGRPTVLAQTPHQPTHLFEESEPLKTKLITLQIKDLIFKGIGVVRLIHTSSNNQISFQDCKFENIVTSREIIQIEGHQHKLNKGTVNFCDCDFINNAVLNVSGAISAQHIRSVFNNCYFLNNLSTGNGSVSLIGGCSTLKNSHFMNNIAASNNSFYLMGGALYAKSNSVVEIINCSFKWNKATFAGGAIFTSGNTLVIESSLFTHNTAFGTSGRGGAVASLTLSFCNISRSQFISNRATFSGGAIYSHTPKQFIQKSLFENNYAFGTVGGGGAVFTFSNLHYCTISECSFKGNKVNSHGAAILYRTGIKLEITSSLFEDNTAFNRLKGGGALYASFNSACHILNSTFRRNMASSRGGAIEFHGLKLTIETSTIISNGAFGVLGGGGGIYGGFGCTCHISNCTFQNNKAISRGGAIEFHGLKLTVKTSSFYHNTVTAKVGGGAAIYAGFNSTSYVSNCSFRRNMAELTRGGAIALYGLFLSVHTSSFHDNAVSSSLGGGGAIFASFSSTCNISSCLFLRNTVKLHGGAVEFLGLKLAITTSYFESNNASGKRGYGGAVYIYFISNCIISQSSFKDNRASGWGGAIFSGPETKLLIVSTKFHNNSVSGEFGQGAAIYVGKKSNCSVSACFFKSNQAKLSGGGIKFDGLRLTIESSLFQNNTSFDMVSGGAAIHTGYSSSCDILNCSFQDNMATSTGGAINFLGIFLTIRGSSFVNNYVMRSPGRGIPGYGLPGYGGAIFAYLCSSCRISESFFIRNTANGQAGGYGGAIFMYFCSGGWISESSFQENMANGLGGAILSKGEKVLHITSSSFEGNMAFDKLEQGTNDFSNTSHLRNTFTSGGAVAFFGLTLTLNGSSFDNNTAFGRHGTGGALFTYLYSACSIVGCSFKRNKASIAGGAISYFGNKLFITSSVFRNNSATDKSGQGGALYTENHSQECFVNISQSLFDGNQALFRGGAIMTITKKLKIRKSSLRSSSYSHNDGYFGGELLYSVSDVILEDVTFQDLDSFNPRNSLIIHQGKRHEDETRTFRFFSFILKTGIQLKCLKGKNIAVANQTFNSPDVFTFLAVTCSFCPLNFYTLSSGYLESFYQNYSVRKSDTKCHHCPLGGVCEKGKIRPSNNFWGYTYGEEVRFASCPFGYCCRGSQCRNYFSCHVGRRGILCGQCEKGLTENLMNPDCLEPQSCQHQFYSVVIIIAGILYLIVFMYLDEISKTVNFLLVPKFTSPCRKLKNNNIFQLPVDDKHVFQSTGSTLKFSQACQAKNLTNDFVIERTEIEEHFSETQNAMELLYQEDIWYESRFSKVLHKDHRKTLFPGLLKILIFFYQTNVLFKIYTGSNYSLLSLCQEVMSTSFNLRFDGIFSRGLSWCPLNNLQPVSKIFVKNVFAVYLFSLVVLIFTLLKIGRMLKIIPTKSFTKCKSRLISCSLRLILMSYAGITITCFSCLSCIELGDLGKVLFIDGSLQCYATWQKIVIAVVGCWIFPFPICTYVSSRLLQNHLISTRKFFLYLLFPISGMCHWLYVHVFCRNKASRRLGGTGIFNQNGKDVLEILEGPFRKSNCNDARKNYRLSWESVLIGRRLVLIFIKTFVINTFIRLSLMMLCTILFLTHHIYIRPFSSKLLNSIETISLLMLNMICFLNLVPAYNYAYPSTFSVHTQGIVKIFQITETALNLLFPFLVGLALGAFICIRAVQFLIWLCKCCFSLIRFCIKYKVS